MLGVQIRTRSVIVVFVIPVAPILFFVRIVFAFR